MDLANAIPVQSIAQEYEELRRRRCPCGGQFKLLFQALVNGPEGTHYDVLRVQCTSCGAEQKIVFAIDSFFHR